MVEDSPLFDTSFPVVPHGQVRLEVVEGNLKNSGLDGLPTFDGM